MFDAPPQEIFWKSIWAIGTLVFYGRFHLQWYVSEVKKRSVMPIAFWYMSSVGALLLFAYAVYEESPLGTLSTCFNIVVYARNLYHVWRERGWLTPGRMRALNLATALILVVSVGLTGWVFWLDYHQVQADADRTVAQAWFWLGIGVMGQVLFGGRWAVQWAATELRKQSVVPLAFWYISLVASLLMIVSFLSDPDPGEKLFAVGLLSTLPVYLRNLWLIHRHGGAAEVVAPMDRGLQSEE